MITLVAVDVVVAVSVFVAAVVVIIMSKATAYIEI
jgi:hypothetical protein